jgi:hypothetical protein
MKKNENTKTRLEIEFLENINIKLILKLLFQINNFKFKLDRNYHVRL